MEQAPSPCPYLLFVLGRVPLHRQCPHSQLLGQLTVGFQRVDNGVAPQGSSKLLYTHLCSVSSSLYQLASKSPCGSIPTPNARVKPRALHLLGKCSTQPYHWPHWPLLCYLLQPHYFSVVPRWFSEVSICGLLSPHGAKPLPSPLPYATASCSGSCFPNAALHLRCCFPYLTRPEMTSVWLHHFKCRGTDIHSHQTSQQPSLHPP